MANFSSFFPVAAAGGGGFTKMLKFTTLRSSDGNYKGSPATQINVNGDTFPPSTSLSGRPVSSADRSLLTGTDSLVGATFTNTNGGTVHTVTANPSHNSNNYFTITFTPALTHSIANGVNLDFNTAGFTINPATDLGLSDGDSIGYFLCGGGYSVGHPDGGAPGGRVKQGTAIISSASTDLVITPGGGTGVNSTISGGLTLTSADGVRGWGGYSNGSKRNAGWSGIMGYGAGGTGNGSYNNMGLFWQNGMPQEDNNHGFGAGAWNTNSAVETGYDGAILIFY